MSWADPLVQNIVLENLGRQRQSNVLSTYMVNKNIPVGVLIGDKMVTAASHIFI